MPDAVALRPPPAASAPPASMDAVDRALVAATQAGLPRVPRPYEALGASLGLTGAQVSARLERLLAAGVMRRLGAVPNHYRLGYVANGMSVWDVDDALVQAAGLRIGALPWITHCYRRPRRPPEWPYNLFAMVHGRDRAETDAKVAAIARLLGDGVRAHAVLYSTRVLKKTGLRIGPGAEG